MDIPRTKPSLSRKRVLIGAALAVCAVGITLGLARLGPAAPTVERAAVWVDTVHRGPMVRDVRGNGTLVPQEVRFIVAESGGRIERRNVEPGAVVAPDTVILVLANPELELAATDSELQLKAAEADEVSQRVAFEHQLLDQRASQARVNADFSEAQLQAQANEALAKDGLVSAITLKVSRARAEELVTRKRIEDERLSTGERALAAQLAAVRARVDQLREVARVRRRQAEGLRVAAGTAGVLQQLAVQLGQSVTPGTVLAKIAEPSRLKAELHIPETQAKDVQIGQKAGIDTRNGIVQGHVIRIDPAVQSGTVTVDVGLDGPLPRGARPDLTVDGTIEIERLADVLYVGRPAGNAEGTAGLFKVVDGGRAAVRVPVRIGRGSVNLVEVVSGLAEGDQVILSDMSAWDAADRIRLH